MRSLIPKGHWSYSVGNHPDLPRLAKNKYMEMHDAFPYSQSEGHSGLEQKRALHRLNPWAPGRSPTTLHDGVQSEMAWSWTRTRLLGTIQKPCPHWTTDLIPGQKPNSICDPERSLILLYPDRQISRFAPIGKYPDLPRLAKNKYLEMHMHFPTHNFFTLLRVGLV